MSPDAKLALTPQECAEQMFAMLVDTPRLDPLHVKTAFGLGFFKTWTVAEIQDEIYCLKAVAVSLTVLRAFGPERSAQAIQRFRLVISAAARSQELLERVERHYGEYWRLLEGTLDNRWMGPVETLNLDTVSESLGGVFAEHCHLKDARQAVTLVSATLRAALDAANDLSVYEITEEEKVRGPA
jgi:hypothetical protein